MPDRPVLQKLLSSTASTAIVETGGDQVSGYVTEAAAVSGLRTPQQLLSAYGVDGAPDFADVVRFEQPLLSTLSRPTAEARPWPAFPHGFLWGDSLAPVWNLSRTRYRYGAEYWRIRRDGEQKCLSRYGGVARGWTGAKKWRPPSPLVGPLARWRGSEFFADVVEDRVELTTVGDQRPDGFRNVHSRVWSAVASFAECEIFERIVTAEFLGVPVRVVRMSAGVSEIVLTTDDPEIAERVKAGLVEPGVYEAIVDSGLLTNVGGIENVLTPRS